MTSMSRHLRGMTPPTEADVDYAGRSMVGDWPDPEDDPGIMAAPLPEVRLP